MIYTRQHFCGHWNDADLARSLAFNSIVRLRVSRELSELERDIAWIKEEQLARAASVEMANG